MDEAKLRQLERQYKLRVKTGCETCRIRRVKCDETKPECNRCTKTGRTCAGYKHAAKSRDQSPAAAASFRNPSFLVVPQKASPSTIPRNPSRSISPEASENRSFFYFQTHTLPKWTEFFDSELWSQKILQLSHTEPAIKHGILALSTLHERFESTTPIFTASSKDFAFVQYSQAVTHSNDLLKAHAQGRADLEKVLIACIIFTCYENLAGNYREANMHLLNGLRILKSHRTQIPQYAQTTAVQESIANVLYRFDLQAMTFSDNTSPYQYNLDAPTDCPDIAQAYYSNAQARDDLVGILRCMMWISGVANINPHAVEDPIWLSIYTRLMASFDKWEFAFASYEQNIPLYEQGDLKVYAGNTLLRIYKVMARTIINSGAGTRTEMAWDASADSFKTMVDLAETLPSLNPAASKTSSRGSSSPSQSSPTLPQSQPSRHRPIAPNPATPSPSPSLGPSTLVFLSDPSAHIGTPASSEYAYSPAPTPTPIPTPKRTPSSFSPSFELSPIVPLFLTACRCRDPIIRRRALALLLNCRRREGVWDSYGAGMVALQCIKLEENIAERVELGPDNWLPTSPKVQRGPDIPEHKRVEDVFAAVNMKDRKIVVNYRLRNGENMDRYVTF
ncbi:hypothetical protein B0J11DRAFT_516671 [Dendryphion nanum]|uniref:Zn(2)-C6 fungal-type domain-containing protein n=1 Tax=Dendryphion nanum TaxID=256645 RepID=A0A9P9EJK5_9PLEO|nr:hypothetical protein B0J11DRAFT_516671 [Dendryphion nanum]